MSESEFEKWYEISATSCNPRTANKQGWYAALRWVTEKMKSLYSESALFEQIKQELKANNEQDG